MSMMKPCPYCRRHVASDDTRCHFCDRPLRMTQASWPAWLLGLSLTGLGACVGGGDGPGSDSQTAGNSQGNSASVGNDTVDDDDWGEGATYAGPDSWTTSEGDTFVSTGTDTADTDCGVETTTSGGNPPVPTGTDTVDDDDWGEGATYAGPDSWTTSEGDSESEWGTTTGGPDNPSDSDAGAAEDGNAP